MNMRLLDIPLRGKFIFLLTLLLAVSLGLIIIVNSNSSSTEKVSNALLEAYTKDIISDVVVTSNYRDFLKDVLIDTTLKSELPNLRSLRGMDFESLDMVELVSQAKEYGYSEITLFEGSKDSYIATRSTEPSIVGKSLIDYVGKSFLYGLSVQDAGPVDALKSFDSFYLAETKIINDRLNAVVYSRKDNTQYIIRYVLDIPDYNTFITENNYSTLVSDIKSRNNYVKEAGVLSPSETQNEFDEVGGTFKLLDKTVLGHILKTGSNVSQFNSMTNDFTYLTILPSKDILYLTLDTNTIKTSNRVHIKGNIWGIMVIVIGILLVIYLYFRRLDKVVGEITIRVLGLEKYVGDFDEIIEVKNDLQSLITSVNKLGRFLNYKDKTLIREVHKLNQLINTFENSESITKEDLSLFVKSVRESAQNLSSLLKK